MNGAPVAPLRVFGVRIRLAPRCRLVVLCIGAIGSALGFAALQEAVFHVPGFTFYGYLTLVTSATIGTCAQLERMATCDAGNRVGFLRQYLSLSVVRHPQHTAACPPAPHIGGCSLLACAYTYSPRPLHR